jgi:hypothetical protein
MRENDWTRVLGWPGYKVYQAEIDEQGKRLKLWVRRKRGNKQDAVSDACESAAARRVARQFGLFTSTVVVFDGTDITIPRVIHERVKTSKMLNAPLTTCSSAFGEQLSDVGTSSIPPLFCGQRSSCRSVQRMTGGLLPTSAGKRNIPVPRCILLPAISQAVLWSQRPPLS